eukprot:COSAG01_NODE_42220_length_442_cov_1.026239_1_plen_69_part_01
MCVCVLTYLCLSQLCPPSYGGALALESGAAAQLAMVARHLVVTPLASRPASGLGAEAQPVDKSPGLSRL